jgi:hypothetical protein
MNLVGHEAKGVSPIAKPTGPFLKQEVETIVLSIVQKDILSAVSPENNMINFTSKMECMVYVPWREHTSRSSTCHLGSLISIALSVSPAGGLLCSIHRPQQMEAEVRE